MHRASMHRPKPCPARTPSLGRVLRQAALALALLCVPSACLSKDVHPSAPASDPAFTCNSCHAKEYAASTKPNHKTAGYNTDCAKCHGITAWSPAFGPDGGP